MIVFAPSNPHLSIGPILSIRDIKDLIIKLKVPKIAVSPLINGQSVKGPAARIMGSMNLRADCFGVAKFYKDLLDVIIIDKADTDLKDEIRSIGVGVQIEDILMTNQQEKEWLSQAVVELGLRIRK